MRYPVFHPSCVSLPLPFFFGLVRVLGFVPARWRRGDLRLLSGSKGLALAVAVTGLLATMPYIALKPVAIQVVLAAMGVGGKGLGADLPLVIAFAWGRDETSTPDYEDEEGRPATALVVAG